MRDTCPHPQILGCDKIRERKIANKKPQLGETNKARLMLHDEATQAKQTAKAKEKCERPSTKLCFTLLDCR